MKKYLTTAVTISVLFFLLCAGKGIFPFGTATIDTVDFASQWVPSYYHIWDVLHGDAGLFFDWRVAGGMDFTGAASQFSLLSPYNLLLLFVKRSQIQAFMIFFIWIKIIAMGLSMCFFLQKMAQKRGRAIKGWDIVWLTAGSVSYALSAYTFFYYGMGWIDIASIFPLLIYNLIQMLEYERTWKLGKYSIGYLICLFLIFCINIPQAYMTCFFLILFAGGCEFLLRGIQARHALEQNGKKNGGGILKFGLTSVLALGASAVVFLPAALNMLGSSRLSGEEYTGENSYFWLLSQGGMDAQVKWQMLFGAGIPFLYLLFTTKKKRRHLLEWYLVVLMTIPVLVEAVNLMWHRGTYMCFPMRHGYMMIFVIIYAAWGHYLEQREHGVWEKTLPAVRKALSAAVIGTWLVLTLGLGMKILTINEHGNAVDFVRDAEELQEILGGESDVLHKVKISDASLDSNYPLISDVASYSNYLHLMSEGQIKLQQALGYSQIWTRISDTGGTLFSDAVLGYRYQVHRKELPERSGMEQYYEPYEETEHFVVSRSRYTYEEGLRMELEAYLQFDQNISGYVFENQNRLSEALFGIELFTVWTENFTDERKNEILHYEIEIPKEGILYLYSKELSGAEIYVNGEKLLLSSYMDLQGSRYLNDLNNGIITLGSFAGEKVDVEIHQTCYDTGIPKEIQFAVLDVERFEETMAQESWKDEKTDRIAYSFGEKSIDITTQADKEVFLLLPVNADAGWQICINGKEEGYVTVYGNLMLIQLKEGENEIHMEALPRGIKKGRLLTLTAGMIVLLWIWLGRRKGAETLCGRVYELVSYAAAAVFFVVWIAFLLVVYVIPIIYSLFFS